MDATGTGAVRGSPRNLKYSRIQLRTPLNQLEQAWLIGTLGARRGVCDVRFHGSSSRLLQVAFDGDLTSSARLFDFLFSCGLPARPAPLSKAPSDPAAEETPK